MDDGVLACLQIKQHPLEDPDTIMISPLLIDGLGLSQKSHVHNVSQGHP